MGGMNRKVSTTAPRRADPVLTRVLHFFEGLSTVQFFAMVFLFFLYVVGNFQALADASMFLLLSILNILGFTAAVTNVICLAAIVIWSIRHRAWLIGRIVFSLITLFMGLGVSLIVVVIHGFILPHG